MSFGSLGFFHFLLGAALIPLGAWPQILPFVALAAVVAAYIAADSWSGGKITRSGGPELAHELEREGYAEVAA